MSPPQPQKEALSPVQSVPVSTPALEEIRALVGEDLQAVDGRILANLASEVPLVNEIGAHIVASGGKRLRPLIVLLSARAFDYDGEAHVDLAAVIEFIHTATLLHDDVVDESLLRRGRETANALWGNQASVLVGDFLYSRAFQMMVAVGSMRVMEVMAETTNTIAEGEVLQLLNTRDPSTTEARYLQVIRAKTAKLFEAAAQLGPILAVRSSREERAMLDYGLRLGMAYQLVDDLLDYQGTAEEIGKNVGDDLAEGKPTLPLIHAMRTGGEAELRLIREAIEAGSRERLEEVVRAVESTGAIAYTARAARQEADRAIAALRSIPRTPYRDGLEELARFAVSRTW